MPFTLLFYFIFYKCHKTQKKNFLKYSGHIPLLYNSFTFTQADGRKPKHYIKA